MSGINFSIQEVFTHCDHTVLNPTSTWLDIKACCDDAIRYHCASVCIPPCFVKQASDYVQGKIPVGTVIGFPHGYMTTKAKIAEAVDAIQNGASEIDVVINICKVKDRDFVYVEQELADIKAAVDAESEGHIVLKVIIETFLLTEEEKIQMCEIVNRVKADFIKTSTGFAAGGALVEDVLLLSQYIQPPAQIKASGGVTNIYAARQLLNAGAARIGESRLLNKAELFT